MAGGNVGLLQTQYQSPKTFFPPLLATQEEKSKNPIVNNSFTSKNNTADKEKLLTLIKLLEGVGGSESKPTGPTNQAALQVVGTYNNKTKKGEPLSATLPNYTDADYADIKTKAIFMFEEVPQTQFDSNNEAAISKNYEELPDKPLTFSSEPNGKQMKVIYNNLSPEEKRRIMKTFEKADKINPYIGSTDKTPQTEEETAWYTLGNKNASTKERESALQYIKGKEKELEKKYLRDLTIIREGHMELDKGLEQQMRSSTPLGMKYAGEGAQFSALAASMYANVKEVEIDNPAAQLVAYQVLKEEFSELSQEGKVDSSYEMYANEVSELEEKEFVLSNRLKVLTRI